MRCPDKFPDICPSYFTFHHAPGCDSVTSPSSMPICTRLLSRDTTSSYLQLPFSCIIRVQNRASVRKIVHLRPQIHLLLLVSQGRDPKIFLLALSLPSLPVFHISTTASVCFPVETVAFRGCTMNEIDASFRSFVPHCATALLTTSNSFQPHI